MTPTYDEIIAAAKFAREWVPAPPRAVTPLSVMLAQYRVAFRLSLRDLEQLTGLDHCALLRLEIGGQPTLATWLRFSRWLFKPKGDERAERITPLSLMLFFYRRQCDWTIWQTADAMRIEASTLIALERDFYADCDATEWLRLQEFLLSPVLMAALPASAPALAPRAAAVPCAGSAAVA